jgi:CheY-like chemotaxis protein
MNEKRKTILIVEDSAIQALEIKLLLESHGLRVVCGIQWAAGCCLPGVSF